MPESKETMKAISLLRLTSTCIDAGRRGCEVIRSFHQTHQSEVGGRLKIGGDPRSVVTQCDIDAQEAIVKSLRDTWGDALLIIGEEDGATTLPTPVSDDSLLRNDLLADLAQDEDIPLEELAIFVDPLDGTREFVEGRLSNVACLIGIARNSRPIAGIIGVPFPKGDLSLETQIHYAVGDQIKKSGIWPAEVETINENASESRVTLFTGDSSNPMLQRAISCTKSLAKHDIHHKIVGGTASKLTKVANSKKPAIAILHFVTELWDTCPVEALLNCKGGKVTDFFGAPLDYDPKRPFGNVFGVVASLGASDLHDELCRSLREDGEVVQEVLKPWMGEDSKIPEVSQAVDIARDLDGIPFGIKDLQEVLKGENPSSLSLVGYSVPEEDAWRGLMSTGARYKLEWEGKDSENQSSQPPSDIFYKRISMAHLSHAQDKLKTAPHKLVRDVKSYQVETSFLTSEAAQSLAKETGMRINKVFASDLRPVISDNPKELLDSRFSIFLEYFQKSDGWDQSWLLSAEEAKAALSELAKMHGYFWHGSDFWKKENGKVGDDLESSVWPNGGYMQPKLQGYEQLKKVRSGWEARYPTFEADLKEIPELDGVDIQSLGKRLEDVAPIVGKESHPFSEDTNESNQFQKYRTLIHGDPKHANFFFRKKEESIEVAIIDFQWSGFGLAATGKELWNAIKLFV